MAVSQPPNVYGSLDLALRIGDLLLASGGGASDVEDTMIAVAHACGLPGVDANVTFTELTLQQHSSIEVPASILGRRVRRRPVDYAELIEVDRLVRDLVDGTITREDARKRVAAIDSSDHQRAQWLVTVSWGAVGASLAVTLGGGPLVSCLAFVTACGIDLVRRATRDRVPSFYQQTAGGLLATLVAVGVGATGVDADPSLIVTAGIILLLAGIGLMGAMADALTGYPLTASARLLDALLATTGVIAGVAAGLTVADLAAADLGRLEPGATGFAQGSAMTLGAGLAGAAYGLACYTPIRAAVAASVVAGLGQAVFLAVDRLSLGQTWAATAGAVMIGTISHGIATRVRVPPLVLIVPAIVPLLPGLSIYRGLALLAEGKDGVLDLAAAGATAIALAAGVILGQYIAQPLRREGVRLENRLSSPSLVGVLRKHPGPLRKSPDSPNDGEPTGRG
jgi:uncharacterized membrane protein YjjP (DUF1212 family)